MRDSTCHDMIFSLPVEGDILAPHIFLHLHFNKILLIHVWTTQVYIDIQTFIIILFRKKRPPYFRQISIADNRSLEIKNIQDISTTFHPHYSYSIETIVLETSRNYGCCKRRPRYPSGHYQTYQL
jgi:hypothetical protein